MSRDEISAQQNFLLHLQSNFYYFLRPASDKISSVNTTKWNGKNLMLVAEEIKAYVKHKAFIYSAGLFVSVVTSTTSSDAHYKLKRKQI